MAPSSRPRFEHFPHEADIGVRGRGGTLAEAFAQAAVALTAVVADPASVRALQVVEIGLEEDDPETLLFEWLNAIVFEMATRGLLFARFDVDLDGRRLSARAHGEPVDVGRHCPAVEVKGATMTGLRVAHERDGSWVAECVVDV